MKEEDFDGQSYSGLTRCIRGRLQDLREYKKFRTENYEILRNYSTVRMNLFYRAKILEMEVRQLISMRRRLRDTPYSNWYTAKIEEYEKAIEDKLVYIDFISKKIK